MNTPQILPLDDSFNPTCDGHMMSGKKSEFEIVISKQTKAVLCPECVKTLFKECAENIPGDELQELIKEVLNP